MYANLLQFICSLLKLHQIPYMVTGSVAVNIYVLPRSTADIDIVIEVPPDKIEEFVHLFDANFYRNHEIARAELQHKGVGMFNIIDLEYIKIWIAKLNLNTFNLLKS